MTTIAISLRNDSNIYKVDLGKNSHEVLFKGYRPDSIAYLGGGALCYVCAAGFKDIYKEELPYANIALNAPDKLVYTHHTYIRDMAIRQNAIKYNFFFSAYHTDTSIRLFYLDEMDSPVTYCTIFGNQLLFPDPCSPGEETHFSTWGGYFTFDDANNLFITTGGFTPSGIYKITGAGPDGVTGTVQPVKISKDESTGAIEFIGNNEILYQQGDQKIFRMNTQTNESTLVFDVASFSTKKIKSIAWWDDAFKKQLIFKRKRPLIKKKPKLTL